MKYIFFLAILSTQLVFGQIANAQKITIDEGLVILHPDRYYTYKAVQISAAGDTLSNNLVGLKPTGRDTSAQSMRDAGFAGYNIEMNYTETDSLNLFDTAFKAVTHDWMQVDTSGGTESEERYWWHPIRANQYYKVEAAPFPDVQFPVDSNLTWTNTIMVLKNWGIYNNSMIKSTYHYEGEEVVETPMGKLNCLKYNATSDSNKVGKSSLIFYYHPQYGFVNMYYEFYDGERISFEMQKG